MPAGFGRWASLLALATVAPAVAWSGGLAAQQQGADGLEARVWFDRGAEPVVQRGDRIRLYYRTSDDAFVAIFQIDTDGVVRLVFPRSPDENHYVRGARDYRLLFPRAPEWLVDDQPGVGYFFAVASQQPFDFSSFSYFSEAGWDLSRVNGQVYTDPYVAMDDYVAALIPDWEYTPYALDFATYHVGEEHAYPRFMCYQCHGFRPYTAWNPYYYSCTSFRVVIYDDPYFYPAYRYRGQRVVYARPVAGVPRYAFRERGRGEPPTPLIAQRTAGNSGRGAPAGLVPGGAGGVPRRTDLPGAGGSAGPGGPPSVAAPSGSAGGRAGSAADSPRPGGATRRGDLPGAGGRPSTTEPAAAPERGRPVERGPLRTDDGPRSAPPTVRPRPEGAGSAGTERPTGGARPLSRPSEVLRRPAGEGGRTEPEPRRGGTGGTVAPSSPPREEPVRPFLERRPGSRTTGGAVTDEPTGRDGGGREPGIRETPTRSTPDREPSPRVTPDRGTGTRDPIYVRPQGGSGDRPAVDRPSSSGSGSGAVVAPSRRPAGSAAPSVRPQNPSVRPPSSGSARPSGGGSSGSSGSGGGRATPPPTRRDGGSNGGSSGSTPAPRSGGGAVVAPSRGRGSAPVPRPGPRPRGGDGDGVATEPLA